MKYYWFKRGVVLLFCAQLIAGCRSAADRSASAAMPGTGGMVDRDDAIARAGKANRPMVILIGEFGPDGADRAIRDLLDGPNVKNNSSGAELIALDLSISRNRAVAARYHLVRTPILVCLSPRGLIVSRDVGAITTDLVVGRLNDLASRAAELDAKLATLQDAVNRNKNDSRAALTLADFLLARQNDREAIPYLAEVASADAVDVPTRIHAWVAMARAHLWIGEPEKARHESKALIAALGPAAPDAIAGGNLVRGLQDNSAKRYALARREFEAAIAAAPESTYAKQAQASLAELPVEGNR